MLIHISCVLAIEGERERAVTVRLNSDETKHFPTNTIFMHQHLIGPFFLEYNHTCKTL